MTATALPNKILHSRRLSLCGYILLLAALLITSLTPPLPAGGQLAMMLGVKLLPLLILAPGLWQHSLRSHVWLCFVLLIYFVDAVLDVTQGPGSWLHQVILVLTVIIFLSSMMLVHWSKKAGIPLNPR